MHENQENKARMYLGDRKYNIYKWYTLNFEEKPVYVTSNKCMWKYFLNGFITAFTASLANHKDKHYCPWCCTEVDSISYNDSPIYTFGCNKCRTRLAKDSDGIPKET